MLLDALAKTGVESKFYRGFHVYNSGLLKNQISKILENARTIGEKIAELTGQQKFQEMLPSFPLCASCGRIYTTHAEGFDPKTGRVHYVCKGVSIKKRWFDGCGYEGEADISKADGKLSWKVEWAARWAALDVRFEAYGKDLAASVMVNDWVSEHILAYKPPKHVQYELFLDASRRKISKSKGVSVFTPHEWFKYGSPQSLVLLFLKRIKGTRVVSPQLIPALMDELDTLGEQYRRNTGDPRRTGLYVYAYMFKPPEKTPTKVSYSLLVFLASIAPEGKEKEFVVARLKRYGYKVDEEVLKKVEYAVNYQKTFGKPEVEPVTIDEILRRAVDEVAEAVRNASNPDTLQSTIFEIARRNMINPPQLFQTLYRILIGQDSGPKLATFIIEDYGVERAYTALKAVTQGLYTTKNHTSHQKSEKRN
ncbi:MAG: lysine--tRNA ligase, partial [Candidatus Caldarchaeum sp.]